MFRSYGYDKALRNISMMMRGSLQSVYDAFEKGPSSAPENNKPCVVAPTPIEHPWISTSSSHHGKNILSVPCGNPAVTYSQQTDTRRCSMNPGCCAAPPPRFTSPCTCVHMFLRLPDRSIKLISCASPHNSTFLTGRTPQRMWHPSVILC